LDTNEVNDLYVFDRQTGMNQLVTLNFENNAASGGSPGSFEASISNDGRYIAYLSSAKDVVPGLPSSFSGANVYVRDMLLGTNKLLTSNSQGVPLSSGARPLIGGDGRQVYFEFTGSSALIPLVPNSNPHFYLFDVLSNSLSFFTVERPVVVPIIGRTFSPGGNYLAYIREDLTLYIQDLIARTNRLVAASVHPTYFSFSPDARNLLFVSSADPTQIGASEPRLYAFSQQSGEIRLVAASISGEPLDEPTMGVAIASDDIVAFSSRASNLGVNGDLIGSDVFLTKLDEPAALICASTSAVPAASATALGRTWFLPDAISLDGRYVVFSSEAADLVANDTNDLLDIFLHDRWTGTNRLITYRPDGQLRTNVPTFIGMSADAKVIAYFASETINSILVHDLDSNSTRIESVMPNGDFGSPGARASLSADGRFLAFSAQNQFLIRDLVTHSTTATLLSDASSTPLTSSRGRYLVAARIGGSPRLFDLSTGESWQASLDIVGATDDVAFSSDESHLLFPGYKVGGSSTNLYLYDLRQRTVQLLTTNVTPPAGLTADGSTVVYQANLFPDNPTNAVTEILAWNVANGTPSPLSLDLALQWRLPGTSCLSADGRFVLLLARPGRTSMNENWNDLYLYDRALTQLTLLNAPVSNFTNDAPSSHASLSADGQTIVFQSLSSTLIGGDINFGNDVFTTRIELPDVNKNGMDDGWDLLHPATLEPDADSDGDGTSNRAEYDAGTDPESPKSNLTITAIDLLPDSAVVTWISTRGKRYQLQKAVSLQPGTWQPVVDVLALGSSQSAAFRLERSDNAFFRIVLSTQPNPAL
jgi:Tol biopolymer transport system component